MDLIRILGFDAPIREYRPADEEGVHRIFEETPMRVGGMELVYERRPRVHAQLDYQAARNLMLVSEREGEIRGLSSFSWGKRWVGGKMASVMYIGDFRVRLDRRIAATWRSLYPKLLNEFRQSPEYGPCEWFVTGILSQNRAAKRSLIDNAKGFFYHRVAELAMVNLFFRPRTPSNRYLPKGVRVVSGDDVGEARLRRFLNDAQSRLFLGYDFGFDEGNEWDRRKRTWPGFEIGAFWVAIDEQGEIVSCTLPWAPTAAKRLRVNRMGGWTSIAFKLLALFGAKTPEIGKPFTTLYLTHLTFQAGVARESQAALIAAFIDRVFSNRSDRDFHMLSYVDPDGRRELPPLKNAFTQVTSADVYLVTTEREPPRIPANDGIVFEMALV